MRADGVVREAGACDFADGIVRTEVDEVDVTGDGIGEVALTVISLIGARALEVALGKVGLTQCPACPSGRESAAKGGVDGPGDLVGTNKGGREAGVHAKFKGQETILDAVFVHYCHWISE
jgi:hypothetical protein